MGSEGGVVKNNQGSRTGGVKKRRKRNHQIDAGRYRLAYTLSQLLSEQDRVLYPAPAEQKNLANLSVSVDLPLWCHASLTPHDRKERLPQLRWLAL